jgi:3-oxoacyl-(acyl-carrier-protein) synthase
MKIYIQNTSSISPQHTFETGDFLTEPIPSQGELPYLSAIEPDYKEYVTDAGLRRRMSRLVKMGVAAALNCVKGSPAESIDAIITATGLGCLTDTEKFLNNIETNDERLLNPTSFIQSTFNTVGAQIALILKNHNYNFTYVHRGFSFETAIIDAMMLLKDKEAENVLVGSVDEITEYSYEVMKRMGFWHNGAKMGEGSQFFMLSSKPSENDFASLKAVKTIPLNPLKGTSEEVSSFLEQNNTSLKDIDLLLLGDSGDPKQDAAILNLKKGLFKGMPFVSFKHLCGEYQTASSFGLFCAANILKKGTVPAMLKPEGKPGKLEKILLYNVYRDTNHSLFLIEK